MNATEQLTERATRLHNFAAGHRAGRSLGRIEGILEATRTTSGGTPRTITALIDDINMADRRKDGGGCG